MIYGPLSPTNCANGPTTIEGQCDCVINVLKKLRDEGKVTLHAKQEAEETWANMVAMIHNATLRSKVNSYYNGEFCSFPCDITVLMRHVYRCEHSQKASSSLVLRNGTSCIPRRTTENSEQLQWLRGRLSDLMYSRSHIYWSI
jgi:hypothetical protein